MADVNILAANWKQQSFRAKAFKNLEKFFLLLSLLALKMPYNPWLLDAREVWKQTLLVYDSLAEKGCKTYMNNQNIIILLLQIKQLLCDSYFTSFI